MTNDIESDLKVQNWLSIVTFDLFKYAKAGGVVEISESPEGLIIMLAGVEVDSESVNVKFKKMFSQANGAAQ